MRQVLTMKRRRLMTAALILASACASACGAAGQDTSTAESKLNTRYSVAAIDDATLYSDLREPLPTVLNQVLVEPSFSLRYRQRFTFSTSLIGTTRTYTDNASQVRVKEMYASVSAGDFDFAAGRKMVRWGTGYAFTVAGVLDPPRNPTDPGDRLSLNQGRDMVKADHVHGPHAFTLAWSSAALAPANVDLHDTTAFRYNVLVHGFDTSLIAGRDRGSDSFGGFTFTRVLGQAWEIHGEGMWREQAAAVLGAKYTTHAGVTLIGEYNTEPSTRYDRGMSLSPVAGRQHSAFFNVGKSRLRERPGWKEWDVSGAIVANLNDRSSAFVVDVNRWFGNHFSSYVHVEVPRGDKTSVYGAAPYVTATSLGVRFQL
jgi:predicted small secreted protein